ncbi:zwei Ig domain protein zig-8-like [Penaeus monodon]|uniref:zwei Ig domain protein zig-8-like n=2 Tax=Penaeus TaxID=133894 RepID=UPI0018A75E9B|nr:zwei Ig domain protein zig-8-like [Penaeus monodon]
MAKPTAVTMGRQRLQTLLTRALLCSALLSLPGSAWARKRLPRHVVPEPTDPGPTLPPVFDPLMPTNVTVTATKTAVLACVVHNLGSNTVSWIRHRDLHILSVGPVTYTTDNRFEAIPEEGAGNWMLRLRYASPRDSGQYDCQVSSRPPTYRTVHLTVVEPQAKILRAPEMHVGVGSPINLTCVVPYAPEPPDYLHWYHKDKMVWEDGERVRIRTQLGRRSISQLLVKNANAQDSGVYTCQPAYSREHSITVHVLTGEYPAPMQGGSSVTFAGRRYWAWLTSALVATAVSTHLLSYFYM